MPRTGDEIDMEENIVPRPSPRSLHSTTGAPVRFINRSRSRVKVLWLDYQGEQVLYSTLEPLSGRYDVNTYVTHPWIALEETTNAVMLLNFRKIYFPEVPEVRHIESDNRSFYVRSEVVITPNGKVIRDFSCVSGTRHNAEMFPCLKSWMLLHSWFISEKHSASA